MGVRGAFSRILGEKLGTLHTYVPVPGRPLLPGMIDIDRMTKRYRAHAVTKETSVFGIIDDASTFIPSDAEELRDFRSETESAVRVPFILGSSEETACLREFFDIKMFFRAGTEEKKSD